MRTRPLGGTGIDITPLGIGTWAMGAGQGGTSNLGPTDDGESIAAIRRAVDLGFNWIDTAAYYGFGHAEEIVARALDGMSERPYVFTKCGLVPTDNGPEAHEFRLKGWSVRAEIEASLRRLRTDVIDLVMVHWPIPEEDVEEGWAALVQLQEQGKVRFIGVSNFDRDQMARCDKIAPVQVNQPEYSLVDRRAEETVFPYARENNVGVIVYSPLKHGILSGSITRERVAALDTRDWRHGHAEYTEPRLTRNLRLADAVRAVAGRHGCTPAEVAVAWVLRQAAVSGAIVGGRRAAQFEAVNKAADLELSAEDCAQLESASAEG
jgi:aryl-alcohol dehydrogenase-like predicted oxidoreductase